MSVSTSLNGNVVLTGEMNSNVKLFDLRTREQVCALDGHTQPVFSVRLSSACTIAASGSLDGSVRLWDLRTTAQPLRTLQDLGGPVFTVSFAAADQWLLFGGQDSTVRFINVADVKPPCCLLGYTSPGWLYVVC
jgi:WD40 repeat protein